MKLGGAVNGRWLKKIIALKFPIASDNVCLNPNELEPDEKRYIEKDPPKQPYLRLRCFSVMLAKKKLRTQ